MISKTLLLNTAKKDFNVHFISFKKLKSLLCSGISHWRGSAEVLKVGGTGAECQQDKRNPCRKPPQHTEGKSADPRGQFPSLSFLCHHHFSHHVTRFSTGRFWSSVPTDCVPWTGWSAARFPACSTSASPPTLWVPAMTLLSLLEHIGQD